MSNTMPDYLYINTYNNLYNTYILGTHGRLKME